MAVKVPITVEGNLTKDPELGQSENGTTYARFRLAVNDREFNDERQEWQDRGDPVFHDIAVFGQQAKNVADSLHAGDRAIATGDLEFRVWNDKETGARRQGTQIVASSVGPSLRFTTAEVAPHHPKASNPEISATGPVAQTPGTQTGADIAF